MDFREYFVQKLTNTLKERRSVLITSVDTYMDTTMSKTLCRPCDTGSKDDQYIDLIKQDHWDYICKYSMNVDIKD